MCAPVCKACGRRDWALLEGIKKPSQPFDGLRSNPVTKELEAFIVDLDGKEWVFEEYITNKCGCKKSIPGAVFHYSDKWLVEPVIDHTVYDPHKDERFSESSQKCVLCGDDCPASECMMATTYDDNGENKFTYYLHYHPWCGGIDGFTDMVVRLDKEERRKRNETKTS